MWPDHRTHKFPKSPNDAECLAASERDVANNPMLEAAALADAEARHADNVRCIKSYFTERLETATKNRNFYSSHVKRAR